MGIYDTVSTEVSNLYNSRSTTFSSINSGGNIRFPVDIDTKAGYITLRFEEYQIPSVNSAPVINPTGSAVILPIPQQLHDRTSVVYEDANLGSVFGLAAQGFANGVTQMTTSNLVTKIGEAVALQGATNLFNNVLDKLGKGGLSTASMNAVSAITGAVVNPFLTVLFKNPSFKRHQFSWRLAPRSQAETEQLRQLIVLLKSNALPSFIQNTANLLFGYPSIVDIAIQPDTYLYQFKKCVIEAVDINFTPAGAPSFFVGMAPTAIDLTLQLLEISLWTSNDFSGGSGPSSATISASPITGTLNGRAAGPN